MPTNINTKHTIDLLDDDGPAAAVPKTNPISNRIFKNFRIFF